MGHDSMGQKRETGSLRSHDLPEILSKKGLQFSPAPLVSNPCSETPSVSSLLGGGQGPVSLSYGVLSPLYSLDLSSFHCEHSLPTNHVKEESELNI